MAYSDSRYCSNASASVLVKMAMMPHRSFPFLSEPIVALTRDIPTRRAIDRTLRLTGVRTQIVAEFDNIDTLKRAVEVDVGLSILPRNTVEREVGAGTLSCVSFRDPTQWIRNISLLRRRGGVFQQIAQAG